MSKKDYVFFPTVYHTGTWFVAGILHHRAGYLFANYTDDKIKPRSTVHFDITGKLDIEKAIDHFKDNYLVIPIRDVLASVISRKRRFPDKPATSIIDGFIVIAKLLNELNPFYFPIDLYEKPKDRERLLISLEKYLGKRFVDVNNITKWEFAEIWWPENVGTASFELKQAYELGETEYLKHVIPEEWEYLIKKQSILQPFFEKLGYKNLLWFKKKSKKK